jgi:hypothetical protein
LQANWQVTGGAGGVLQVELDAVAKSAVADLLDTAIALSVSKEALEDRAMTTPIWL